MYKALMAKKLYVKIYAMQFACVNVSLNKLVTWFSNVHTSGLSTNWHNVIYMNYLINRWGMSIL